MYKEISVYETSFSKYEGYFKLKYVIRKKKMLNMRYRNRSIGLLILIITIFVAMYDTSNTVR